MEPSTYVNKTAIIQEVTDSFTDLIDAINRKDAGDWAAHYSQEAFASAAAGGDFFAMRSDWVQTITSCFSMREHQHVALRGVQVVPLAPDTALLTSQEVSDMKLTNGQRITSRHMFTMVWKKEKDGWRILHSHESWVDEPVA